MAKALLALTLGALCLLSSFAYAAAEKKQPAWGELNGEQRQILAPLESDWDQMEPQRKKKWVGIAKRYPKMKNDQQQRVQQQMQAWAKLTTAERRAARERRSFCTLWWRAVPSCSTKCSPYGVWLLCRMAGWASARQTLGCCSRSLASPSSSSSCT